MEPPRANSPELMGEVTGPEDFSLMRVLNLEPELLCGVRGAGENAGRSLLGGGRVSFRKVLSGLALRVSMRPHSPAASSAAWLPSSFCKIPKVVEWLRKA